MGNEAARFRSIPVTNAPRIRPFRSEDIEAVTQILQKSPGAAAWPQASHEKLLRQSGVFALVTEAGSAVTGYIVVRVVADEAEVLNLAVAPEWRRRGLGSALLLALIKELQSRQLASVFLEVRESNHAALDFYNNHGFLPTGRRTAYYRDPVEDAICMVKKVTG